MVEDTEYSGCRRYIAYDLRYVSKHSIKPFQGYLLKNANKSSSLLRETPTATQYPASTVSILQPLSSPCYLNPTRNRSTRICILELRTWRERSIRGMRSIPPYRGLTRKSSAWKMCVGIKYWEEGNCKTYVFKLGRLCKVLKSSSFSYLEGPIKL